MLFVGKIMKVMPDLSFKISPNSVFNRKYYIPKHVLLGHLRDNWTAIFNSIQLLSTKIEIPISDRAVNSNRNET